MQDHKKAVQDYLKSQKAKHGHKMLQETGIFPQVILPQNFPFVF